MSFDLAGLRATVAAQGRVARVVVAATRGSVPREVGAAMLVWESGQSGTIGGGALEFEAAARAFEVDGASQHPLGPALGQCCGGAVTLWSEVWDVARLDALETGSGWIARGPGTMPLAVQRTLAQARGGGAEQVPQLIEGWMVEPVLRPQSPIWIYGAGHVGRALVAVLAPLPGTKITWIDTAADRFPKAIPDSVTQLVAADPALAARHAPEGTHHLILTYSHALDLALCHALLSRPAASIGLIGSATKWARFRARLRDLGHLEAALARITCPIGDPALGKHPHAIAVGVAVSYLARPGVIEGRQAQ